MNKISQAAVAFLGIALCTGCASTMYRSKSYGDLYTINKNVFHLITNGSGPTVIFSGGSGVNDPYYTYRQIIEKLAVRSKVAVYERPGYGLSSPVTSPKEVDVLVAELDELFVRANLEKPYILMGHSMASLELLRYAQVYPQNVKAVVLLDGAPPEFYATWKKPPAVAVSVFSLFSARGVNEEVQILVKNADKVAKAGSIGNILLYYFSAGKTNIKNWQLLQESFKTYSEKSRNIFIQKSGHMIHKKYSERIMHEIQDLF